MGSVVATALLVTNLSGALNLVEGAVGHGWLLGLILAAFIGLLVGIIGWLQGTGLGTRVTDLGLAVAKLGRGGTEVRVRIRGNDEVTALSRAVQHPRHAVVISEAQLKGPATLALPLADNLDVWHTVTPCAPLPLRPFPDHSINGCGWSG